MRLIVTTVKNFLRHSGTDLAAGLTYYAVLAIFPAALALLSLLSILGDAPSALKTVNDVLRPLLSADAMDRIEPTLRDLTHVDGAPLVLAIGIAVALYSASGYVGAFGRAMNRVHEIAETRPFWKLRPLNLVITVAAVLLNVVVLAMATLTGPVARSVGDKLGIGHDVIHIWDRAKWPVLALVVLLVIAMLYQATPDVKARRVRVITFGAFAALLIGVVASAGFAYYVTNFSSYNKTYGSIAGAVVFLLWLWLINVSLVFGAELDVAREARRDERDAAQASMAAAPGPVDLEGAAAASVVVPVDLEQLMPPAMVTSSRRRDKVRVTEMFPRKGNEPPYGPITQPIPDED